MHDCKSRHLAHLGGEEGGWEPRLAGAQHCAEAGIWSLQYGGFCHFVKAYFVIFADLHFKEGNFQF